MAEGATVTVTEAVGGATAEVGTGVDATAAGVDEVATLVDAATAVWLPVFKTLMGAELVALLVAEVAAALGAGLAALDAVEAATAVLAGAELADTASLGIELLPESLQPANAVRQAPSMSA